MSPVLPPLSLVDCLKTTLLEQLGAPSPSEWAQAERLLEQLEQRATLLERRVADLEATQSEVDIPPLPREI